MNREQFDDSMKRVLAFTQSPKNAGEVQHLQNYMNGLYEAVGSMDGFLFDKVTVELCRNMSRGQRPMPGQFWAIYKRLKDEQYAGQPERICPSCNNTIWIVFPMMEIKTGLEMNFAKPCPECQPKHPYKDAPTREGWVPIERLSPPEPRREQVAPLPVAEHVPPPQGTTSVAPMVAEAPGDVAGGEEYEVET